MSLPATVINTLKEISGNSSVLTDPVQLIGYENDVLGFHRHQPDAVVIPNGSEELIKIVSLIKNEDIPYVLRGGGASLSGGPTPL
jgi:FAD/FMN-containing dehydrogenase